MDEPKLRPGAGLGNRSPELFSDEDLLRDLHCGDRDAFSELMKRYSRLVYRVAEGVLRDHGEAEDMVQNVFWEAYRSLARFDRARGSVRTWLLQIAYSRSLGRLKYLNRRSFYHAIDVSDAANQLYMDETVSNGIETCQLVQRALAELNASQRQVIHMSQLEGHSLRDIAEQIGESYDAVRHHYYRGIAKMRAVLNCSPAT